MLGITAGDSILPGSPLGQRQAAEKILVQSRVEVVPNAKVCLAPSRCPGQQQSRRGDVFLWQCFDDQARQAVAVVRSQPECSRPLHHRLQVSKIELDNAASTSAPASTARRRVTVEYKSGTKQVSNTAGAGPAHILDCAMSCATRNMLWCPAVIPWIACLPHGVPVCPLQQAPEAGRLQQATRSCCRWMQLLLTICP